jgi:hypothetical protein
MKPITAKEAREITDAYAEAGMDDILKNIREELLAEMII